MKDIPSQLDELRTRSWTPEWHDPANAAFVRTGDEKLLQGLKHLPLSSYSYPEFHTPPDQLDEFGNRYLRLLAQRQGLRGAVDWVAVCHHRTGAAASAVQKLRTAGFERARLLPVLASGLEHFMRDQAAEIFDPLFESCSPEEIETVLAANHPRPDVQGRMGSYFASRTPEKLEACIRKMTGQDHWHRLTVTFWESVLLVDAARFKGFAITAYEKSTENARRFFIAAALHTLDPSAWSANTREAAVKILQKNSEPQDKTEALRWMAHYFPDEVLPFASAILGGEPEKSQWGGWYWHHRKAAFSVLAESVPHLLPTAAAAAWQVDDPKYRLEIFQIWMAAPVKSSPDDVLPRLADLCAAQDGSVASAAARAAWNWNAPAAEETVWGLINHKSKPARDTAARLLAKDGAARLPRAVKLLADKKPVPRETAVALVSGIGGDEAVAALKSRLDPEENDNVRDAILLALERAGGGAALSPEDVAARIAKTVPKLKGPPAKWLNPDALTRPKKKDGTPLTDDELAFLLYRQSRCKDIRADLEAKPLYAQIDRSSSGATALEVVSGFLASGADAADRWTLAFGAMLGDDRLVPVLRKQIDAWAESSRGKLAEYAVQALALLGTDAALMAVDSLSIRYRSKVKNIGAAASAAFAAAAEARGLTVEELGDLVVPWLGFTPGQPRMVEAGKATLEVRLTPEFKLAFRDSATGKKVPKLPDGAAPEVKTEFKELTGTLKEAVKAQLLRMETLLVRQFRWPVEKWRSLYLKNPLLRPFAQRLVWARCGEDGTLTATFRALEDGSLTDAADDPVTLPDSGTVHIVHPLSLTPEARQAWLQHCADYDLVAPFPQLERPVVAVRDDQRTVKIGEEFAGTELNGMTFKGRAERLGWVRGSVVDAGYISGYRKVFPGDGVEVFLAVEGMYIGMGVEDTVKLGHLAFTRPGTVTTGSYVYDEPRDEKDERLIAWGDVPPIAFSETMGDMAKISGKGAAEAVES
jgi:hypothetical protein